MQSSNFIPSHIRKQLETLEYLDALRALTVSRLHEMPRGKRKLVHSTTWQCQSHKLSTSFQMARCVRSTNSYAACCVALCWSFVSNVRSLPCCYILRLVTILTFFIRNRRYLSCKITLCTNLSQIHHNVSPYPLPHFDPFQREYYCMNSTSVYFWVSDVNASANWDLVPVGWDAYVSFSWR